MKILGFLLVAGASLWLIAIFPWLLLIPIIGWGIGLIVYSLER